MESKYNFIQVYNVWVNGRDIEDVDQHYPLNSNIPSREWHSDLKLAIKEYFKAKVKDSSGEFGYHSEIFKDYIVTLYSIDIDIDEFEKKYNMKFDINNDIVQEMIPYYVDYDFNTVAERINDFN